MTTNVPTVIDIKEPCPAYTNITADPVPGYTRKSYLPEPVTSAPKKRTVYSVFGKYILAVLSGLFVGLLAIILLFITPVLVYLFPLPELGLKTHSKVEKIKTIVSFIFIFLQLALGVSLFIVNGYSLGIYMVLMFACMNSFTLVVYYFGKLTFYVCTREIK